MVIIVGCTSSNGGSASPAGSLQDVMQIHDDTEPQPDSGISESPDNGGEAGGEMDENGLVYRADSLKAVYSLVSADLTGFIPLRRGSRYAGWIRDIDGDGSDDAVFLCVGSDSDTANAAELSRDIRIYDDGFSAVSFAVFAFFSEYVKDGLDYRLTFRKSAIELGSFRALRSYKELELGPQFPFSIEVYLLNETSSVKSWLFFKNGVSAVHLKESPRHSVQITDIDHDGVVDIVMSEKVFEEGAGEETFLSWYKWTGETFEEYSNTNIVRNLNSFLYQISYLVEHQNWNRFSRYALEKEVQRKIQSAGMGRDAVFNLFFAPSEHSLEIAAAGIRLLRFQEILENPFSDSIRQVIIPCKITADYDYFFSVRVMQSGNPFIQPQFVLLPQSGF